MPQTGGKRLGTDRSFHILSVKAVSSRTATTFHVGTGGPSALPEIFHHTQLHILKRLQASFFINNTKVEARDIS